MIISKNNDNIKKSNCNRNLTNNKGSKMKEEEVTDDN